MALIPASEESLRILEFSTPTKQNSSDGCSSHHPVVLQYKCSLFVCMVFISHRLSPSLIEHIIAPSKSLRFLIIIDDESFLQSGENYPIHTKEYLHAA